MAGVQLSDGGTVTGLEYVIIVVVDDDGPSVTGDPVVVAAYYRLNMEHVNQV